MYSILCAPFCSSPPLSVLLGLCIPGASPAKEDSKESDFWKMLHEPEEQAPEGEEAQAEEQEPNLEAADPVPGSPDDFQNNVQVKVIRSPADLIQLIEELKGGTRKGKPDAGQEQPADGATEAPPREPEVKEKSDPEHQNEVEEEEDDEDEDDEDERQLLGEFEKELEGILLPSDRDRLRAEVKAGMERELENIIQEVSSALPPAASAAAHTYGWHRPRGQKRTKSSASAAWGTGQGAPNC